jgi:hypothetical protein
MELNPLTRHCLGRDAGRTGAKMAIAHYSRLIKFLIIAGTLGLCAAPAFAAHPCGAGNEHQVGEMPAGSGVGAVPMCEWNSNAAMPAPPTELITPMTILLARVNLALDQAKREVSPEYRKLLADKRKLEEGSWRVFQEGDPPIPGKRCNALYMNPSGIVTIGTSGGINDPALFIFTGSKIPRSKKMKPVKVRLNTFDGPIQTVSAVNYPLKDIKYGSIFIEIQSLQSAIDNMKDQMRISISMDGKDFFDISWQNGSQAKDKLVKCARG